MNAASKRLLVVVTLASSSLPFASRSVAAADVGAVRRLAGLSLAQLSRVEVSTLSRSPQPLSDAPAAVYVITHEQIMRSGARSLPEILRLAPNLQVARINATSYAISARGFNLYGADKLLVLIDGRSIYTPYFSGVFWDAPAVPPEDIERIEVISGPGATLWGPNAVNGVINIITRPSSATRGGYLDVTGGNLHRGVSAQYGASLGNWIYRVYADGMQRSDDTLASGGSAEDGWHRTRAGFRSDWSRRGDSAMIEGDLYTGRERQLGAPDEHIGGGSLLARWTRRWGERASLQVQGSYDRSWRGIRGEGGDFLNIYDVTAQNVLSMLPRQQIVWGGEIRIEQDRFANVFTRVPALFFDPAARTLTREDLFAQDTLAATEAVKVTLGMKLEEDAYSSLQPLPSVRLAWQASERQLLWAAVSRAIRAPSREDRNLDEAFLSGATPRYVLKGGHFRDEKLIAYEAGYRAQPAARLSLSVSLFYNEYNDLRDIEPTPGTVLPLMFGNGMAGHTQGAELWASYDVTPWWRLSAGGNMLREHLHFVPGSGGLGGIQQAGDDPGHQFSLRSSMDLPHGVSFDADLRQIASLPDPAVPAYTEVDARVSWAVARNLSLALTGRNLVHARHVEFVNPPNTVEIGRSYRLEVQWRSK